MCESDSRLRGEVGICALSALIPGEGASPRVGASRQGAIIINESALVERPPHPDPLHSPSKTGVNALLASGEREKSARPSADGDLRVVCLLKQAHGLFDALGCGSKRRRDIGFHRLRAIHSGGARVLQGGQLSLDPVHALALFR